MRIKIETKRKSILLCSFHVCCLVSYRPQSFLLQIETNEWFLYEISSLCNIFGDIPKEGEKIGTYLFSFKESGDELVYFT